MTEVVDIQSFITLSAKFRIVDVRSPMEFSRGHIPGAVNIPLFDDQERKVVGTAYKQVNREAAMYAGLEFAGKKLVEMAKAGERAAGNSKTLLVHCWRGGMRSNSMAWLFGTLGLKCYLLEGGYKSFRTMLRKELGSSRKLLILGGRTGSGKTDTLAELKKRGEQVVDLEGLANHKGSAFGALGEEPQPSTEHFENLLWKELHACKKREIIWVEDESRNVGKCVVPPEFYQQMREARILFLDIPREVRAECLVEHYAGYRPDELKACIEKISKKLGGDRTREAMKSVDKEDFFSTAMITLAYYDKSYMFSLQKNHSRYEVLESGTTDPAENAGLLLQYLEEDGKEKK